MIKNVIDYLKESAEKYPDKIAFTDGNFNITYKELDNRAQKLAALICDKCGEEKNKPIAVYMDKSVDCIVAFMGIVYSGNYYSPLDPKSPKDRINRIVNVLQPIAVVCSNDYYEKVDFLNNTLKLNLLEESSRENMLFEKYESVLDVDPLYVLFTSGSTGQPKGVVISHKSVIDYVEWLESKFEFSTETIFGNQAPFYFDNSVLDIYSTIKNGAQMVIIPERMFLFPQALLEYINEKKINTLFWVPSALIGVANSGVLDKIYLDVLEKVLFCGEVMPNKQLNIWRKHYPKVLFANLYGPTEITDVCTYYIVDREFADEESLPIGKACENTEILVLNENNQLVQNGEIGELCVRGICLSMGYYGDMEKTNSAFVQNPLNTKYNDLIYRTGDLVKYNELGEIIYVCRKDFQIKHQGHRIELGEIETMANSLAAINQSCAIYDEQNKKIVLFCSINGEITEKEIYKMLESKIPRYMLPSKIYILEMLPLNLNGKIDRVYLKKHI